MCGSSWRRSDGPTAGGCGSTGRSDRTLQRSMRNTTLRPRRRLLTVNVSTPGSAMGRSWRSTWKAVSSGRAISAEEYAPFQTRWGHGSSPMLFGDLLILLCDHLSDAYLLAVDARTGKERWKVDRGDGRLSQYAAGRARTRRPRASRQLVPAHRCLRSCNGEAVWYTGARGRRRFPLRSSMTAGSI